MSYQQATHGEPLLIEMGREGRIGLQLPSIKIEDSLPEKLRRKTRPNLPQISQLEVVRHYTRLSQMNFGVDTDMYPLGSCTMKYNPKICEEIAGWEKVTDLHPHQYESTVQGALQIMYELENMLCEIAGVDAVSLQPAAGAHGEFTGMLLVRAFHKSNGENDKRTEVIIPDTAHGTNPASATMAGYDILEIPSNTEGCVDMNALRSALSQKTAAFMLTNPNTLGIFEENILEIANLVHKAGALLYYDGANLNAIMGKARPGDMGFDIVHFNLHKTFSTPHGGGGPGGGALGVKNHLKEFLPTPLIKFDGIKYYFDYNLPNSIGKLKNFYGNFGMIVRTYTYILMMGNNGLKEAAEIAVLNSNYMKEKLKPFYTLTHRNLRKHEFVLSCANLKKKGVRALDVAKRLLDYGFHAPTIYFPHIVEEALMIEPTESEPKENLDRYIEALKQISQEDPAVLKGAPHNTPVRRVDEVYAARNLVLTWKDIPKK